MRIGLKKEYITMIKNKILMIEWYIEHSPIKTRNIEN